MRITSYKTELDKDMHNVLVKEKSCNYPIENLMNPEAITSLLNDIFGLNRQAEEYVYMIALNTKGRPLGVFEISHGTVNQSICAPRDIFVKSLFCGACSIILAHNHPSGDCIPSLADINVCGQVKRAGAIIGIELLDNIIIGGDSYYSFMENRGI